jgi:hypothetical protein
MPTQVLMTIFAFPFLDFIQNKRMIFFCYIFMALCTCHNLVSPIQFECGGIMIKFIDFPLIRAMTSLAIGCSILFKLQVMNVHMTTGTG